MGKGQLEALHLILSLTLPYMPFPLDDFNLYRFPVIYCNNDYNSFH